MVVIEEMNAAGIPVLQVVAEERKNEKLPFVIFGHGFKSVREKNLHYGFLLAKKGFRVALPTAVHHAEREQGLSEDEMDFHFWNIILQSIVELEKIKDFFEKKNLIDPERIGVAGTSMGGIVTLGALTKYPWIKAAVSLMGMPSYTKFFRALVNELEKQGIKLPINDEELQLLTERIAAVDLSKQAEKLSGRPLLFWHGKKDPVVPFILAYEFYEENKHLYAEHPEKLQFIVDENAEHKVSWEAVLKLVEWFEKYL